MELIEEMVEALKDAQRYTGIYAHADNVAKRLNDNFTYLINKYSASRKIEDAEREQEVEGKMKRPLAEQIAGCISAFDDTNFYSYEKSLKAADMIVGLISKPWSKDKCQNCQDVEILHKNLEAEHKRCFRNYKALMLACGGDREKAREFTEKADLEKVK